MVKDLLLEASENASVDDNFMVKSVSKNIGTNGKPYLSIILQDVTGNLDAKKWEVSDSDLNIIVPGQIIGVQGVLLKYRGKPQLKISNVFQCSQSMIDRSKYTQTAPLSRELMIQEVRDFIDKIKDKDIKAVCEGVLKDNWESYITFPAAKTIHQAYETGLLFHSLSVCKIGYSIAKLYPDLFDMDYVIAGCLMHDIGKVQEFNGPVGTEYTRIGKLESHIQIGAMIVNRKCLELHISQEKTDLLTHIILSHHGVPEYGSPIVPKTPEAYLVHVADDTDAKCDVMRTALKGIKPGEFTPGIKAMDGNEFYKKIGE